VSASGPAILSVDIGSSSVRSCLFDPDGEHVPGTSSRRPHRFAIGPGGRVEADPEILAGLAEDCIDESLRCPAAADRAVAAVAFTSFLHGMIGADGEGRALTPLVTWADSRSIGQSATLRARLDPEAVRQRTGCPLHPVYFPSKLLWFRENLPRLFDDARAWCSIGEYCLRRFTGRAACSLSMASGFGLLNRRTDGWDEELLNALGLDETRFSPLADLDSPIRGLLPSYARRWPRLRDSAWLSPLGDGACSNVGCGCTAPGRIAVMIGTTGAMRVVRPAGDAPVPAGLWSYRLDRSRELIGGVLGDGGNLFEWLGSTVGRGLDPRQLDDALLAAPPAAHGIAFLPFLTGERSMGWDTAARGAVIGVRHHSTGLDILQAGVEAVAYRFAAILRALRSASPDVGELVGTGGALRASAAWGQILADVLELPLGVADEPEASSRGAAILALESMGFIPRAESVRTRIARVFHPRPEAAERHRRAGQAQERLRAAICGPRAPAFDQDTDGITSSCQSSSLSSPRSGGTGIPSA
jgi:gluconokinase